MLRAFYRFTAYILVSISCASAQTLLLATKTRNPGSLPRFYHRCCCRIFRIEIETQGEMCKTAPCIFMANHSSYLDIPALGSIIPASFVAKSEVARWPVFGWLAKLQHTLFIDRRPSQVGKTQTALTARLRKGHNLILFPEGTSSDGVRVLPFRHALFQTVINEAKVLPGLALQPVTVTCVGMNGLPADRTARQKYAWFGDMTLISHLWKFARLDSCTLRITFHEPILPEPTEDRRSLASTVENKIANGMAC